MAISFTIPSPLQKIEEPLFKEKNVEVYIKRDDEIHPEISGNKWRKLRLNIEKFHSGKYDALLTFGGAFSNHIAATAALCGNISIPSIGIIRGDELIVDSNKTLQQAHQYGMQLIFVSRDEYNQRYERIYHEELRTRFKNILIVPEGGANYLGALGAADSIKELPFEPTHIYLAMGTGTTSAGCLLGAENATVIGVPALKGGDFLRKDIEELVQLVLLEKNWTEEKMKQLQIESDFHFGGYGKHTNELIQFITQFYQQHQIKLDHVYTAKMMYAFYSNLKADKIKPNSKVVVLHTGGLQGLTSIKEQLIF